MKRSLLLSAFFCFAIIFTSCDKMPKSKSHKALEANYANLQSKVSNLEKKVKQKDKQLATIRAEYEMRLDSCLNPPMPENSTIKAGSGGKYRFHCIVGSFKEAKFAESYAEKTKGHGYDEASIIEGTGSYYFVSAVGYNNYNEAIKAKNTLRSSFSVNTWILDTQK